MKKIYILHGWAYSTEKWEPFVSLLKKSNLVIEVLKIPGLTAPLTEAWTIENYVEWLKKILEKETGKVILLGHSNGARISLAFSLKYPEKVDQLFLLDSAGIYHNELPIKLKRFVFGTLAKFGKRVRNIKLLRVGFYKFVREHDYEKANPVVRETMTNLINHDLSDELQNILVPTTIIWGENDKVTILADGKLMHDKIKNSTLHIIKDARHSPQFTHAEEVASIVAKELK